MGHLEQGTPFSRRMQPHEGFVLNFNQREQPRSYPTPTKDLVLYLSPLYTSPLSKDCHSHPLLFPDGDRGVRPLVTDVASVHPHCTSSSGVCQCILFSCASVWLPRSGKALLPWLLSLSLGTHPLGSLETHFVLSNMGDQSFLSKAPMLLAFQTSSTPSSISERF